MLSTLDPILINTTQKSVESKQGICSSKPNAQQKLHAQKTFEIQKQFTNFFSSVTHSIHHKRASTGSSNFISCSTIISCLPCSFSPKYGTGTPKKTLCIRKEGIYCGSMRRERKRETYVCGWIRSAGLRVWRSGLEFTSAKGVLQCGVGSRRCETKFPRVPLSFLRSPTL